MKLRRFYLFALSLQTYALNAHHGSNTCVIQEKIAKVISVIGETHVGKSTLIRSFLQLQHHDE